MKPLKKFWKFIKDNWIGVLLIVLLLFMIFDDGCHKKPKEPETIVTIVRDTVTVQGPTVYLPKYLPSKVVTLPPKIKTVEIPADTAELARRYEDLYNRMYSTNVYKDSITLKDTSGREVGIVNITDSIRENELFQRELSYRLKYTYINTTITKETQQPIRRSLSIGPYIQGSQNTLIKNTNILLAYKNKKENNIIATIGVEPFNNFQVVGGLGYTWKLSFR